MGTSSCTPTAITGYISVNGTWAAETSATVSATSTPVTIGPQPVSGGSWSWSNGATTREISPTLSTGVNTFTATYTNPAGCTSTQAFTITVSGGTTCTPTAITGYISVSGTWYAETSATVTSTSTAITIGPQPVSGGSWSWSGPSGFTSTSREISPTLSAGANVYTATYTNPAGCKSTQAFTINAPTSGGSLTLTPTSSSVSVAVGSSMIDAISVTGASSATLTASSSSTSVATASVSGETITISGVSAGTATISVSGTSGSLSASTSISVTVTGSSCTSTPIVGYVSVSGIWSAETSASVNSTTTAVNIGPQPTTGTWSWSGPNGFTSTAREIDNIALGAGANVYTATYTNSCGAKTTQAFTITAPGNTGGCTATAITPYIYANGVWVAETSASVSSGSTVDIGPQPSSSGSWSWTGPNGFTSTSREIDNIALPSATDTYTATYTNSCGTTSTQAFTITLSSGGGSSSGATTAWHNGSFNVDANSVVSQSNIVLQAPNTNATQAMPLGNGNVGAAVWSANGMTIQMNRNDTFPGRYSLGWIVIPGLSSLTGGSNYSGKDDLYNGQFVESGGGMTATVFVRHDKDEIVIEVTGANPNTTQTAQLQLWSGRSPTTAASGSIAALSQTFVDNSSSVTSSGQTFGTLAGITASGQNVSASVVNSTTVQVSFKPNSNGTFSIIVAAPSYNGSQNAMSTVSNLIGSDTSASQSSLQSATTSWWNSFWSSTGLINITSGDGGGAYVENVRDVNIFLQAASSSGQFPGHHAGVADMFNFAQDSIPWDPAAYWQWNLRMFTGANLAAGHPELNNPYFNLYASNLSNMESWTKSVFSAGNGSNACVPEIMRFNGNGSASGGVACWPAKSPEWDALILSTGAEVGYWIWETYLYTGNRSFLSTNYPVMAASARFYLSYATKESDGLFHVFPTNAHEDQWGINDTSMNDVVAMKALFPETVQAAQLLGTDSSLVSQLQSSLSAIPDYPRTDLGTRTENLTASADAGGQDTLSDSYVPTAAYQNSENNNLEPVWPFGLIGDNSSLTALALRTYKNRKYTNYPDWTFDAVQAARLGNSGYFSSAIQSLITSYQSFPSGIGNWMGQTNYFYDEMGGGLQNAVQEALVQDYDGLLRIAPAWPSSNWGVSGTVFIQGNSKVHVQIQNGQLVTAVVEAGSSQNIVTRNPWGTQNVQVVDGSSGATVVGATTASQFTIPAQSGHSYVIEQVSSPTTSLSYAQVVSTPASQPKSMWGQVIGIQ